MCRASISALLASGPPLPPSSSAFAFAFKKRDTVCAHRHGSAHLVRCAETWEPCHAHQEGKTLKCTMGTQAMNMYCKLSATMKSR